MDSSMTETLVTRTISYRVEASWTKLFIHRPPQDYDHRGRQGYFMGSRSWRCWREFHGWISWVIAWRYKMCLGYPGWDGGFQVAETAEMRPDRECSTSHASGLMLRGGEGLVGDFVVLWGKITQGSWIWNRLTIVFLSFCLDSSWFLPYSSESWRSFGRRSARDAPRSVPGIFDIEAKHSRTWWMMEAESGRCGDGFIFNTDSTHTEQCIINHGRAVVGQDFDLLTWPKE